MQNYKSIKKRTQHKRNECLCVQTKTKGEEGERERKRGEVRAVSTMVRLNSKPPSCNVCASRAVGVGVSAVARVVAAGTKEWAAPKPRGQ